jgi:hypothetical protein
MWISRPATWKTTKLTTQTIDKSNAKPRSGPARTRASMFFVVRFPFNIALLAVGIRGRLKTRPPQKAAATRSKINWKAQLSTRA